MQMLESRGCCHSDELQALLDVLIKAYTRVLAGLDASARAHTDTTVVPLPEALLPEDDCGAGGWLTVRENLRSYPGRCFQGRTWASKCISLLSVGVSS